MQESQHNNTERNLKNLNKWVPYYCVDLRNLIPVVFFTKIFLKEIFITNGQCLKQESEGICSVLLSAVLER